MKLRSLAAAAALLAATTAAGTASAQDYAPGVSDTEILIGNTYPYSGPASAFGVGGKVFEAYFKMLNETQGGINGRKIVVHTLDDGYNPAKTVEQTRRLVEGDEVFAIVATLGTPPNLAISKYLNTKGVPQLLAISGNAELNDGENLPWTTNFFTSQEAEGRIYARYILDENPDAKIAILYQNDDFGRGYLDAFLDELGDKAETMVVAEKSYDLSQPTVDSEVVTLASSGADVFFDITSPKFTAQAIKKAYDIGWTPLHMVLTASTQPSVINSVGAEAANGLLTARYNKAVEDPIYDNDTGVQRYKEFMATYLPDLNFADSSNQLGYGAGALAAQIIEACGDALTRENLIDKATHIEGLQLPLFLDGVTITVTPEDRQPWKASQMARFDGEAWKMFGPVIALDG